VFSFRRPSEADIARFLESSRDLPLSYAPVGLGRHGAGGYQLDELTTRVGHGEADFDRAKTALAEWMHFQLGWVQVYPPSAPITPGSVVAVCIRHLGFWSLNGCRVVYAIEGAGGLEWGFAYGTLANHAETGEEVFTVTFHPATGEVAYVIRAASRPRAMLARLGYPVVRALQARFRRDSARAMQHALSTNTSGSTIC